MYKSDSPGVVDLLLVVNESGNVGSSSGLTRVGNSLFGLRE